MALEADYFDYRLAIDPTAGAVVPNATAEVYDVEDTAFGSPLPITDVTGAPLTQLLASPTGVFPQFMVTSGATQVMIRTGSGIVTPAVSVGGAATPATDTVPGVVKLAPVAVVLEGLNDQDAVTPAGVKAAIDDAGVGGGGGGGTVYFGSDANTARPETSAPVVWVGNTGVSPINAVENDLVFTSAVATDTTAPTAGTVAASSITATGFTLTVSGASDETALHASPYAFSTNNGSTWSAYQTSNVYVASGLAPSTGYTVRHRVRDAAGNVSVGASVSVTTGVSGDTVPPTPGTIAGSAVTSSGFTLTISGASDETALSATPYSFSTNNGSTWSTFQASNVYAVTGRTASTGYQCKGRVKDAAGNSADTAAVTVTTAAGDPVTFRQSAVDTTDAATYTFAATPIGTASGSRRVIVAADWSGTTSLALSSMTIGGVAATVDVDSGAITGNRRVVLASAVVPTGATADVVLNLSGSGTRAGIAVWTGEVTPTGQSDISIDLETDNLTVTTNAGDTVICAGTATKDTNNPVSVVWTGATERYEDGFETTQHKQSGADVVASGASTSVTYAVSTTVGVPDRKGFVAAVYA